MEQLYASQSQPVCKATLCVARDRVKVQSRRKYVFTDQIDQLIREIYLNHRDAKTRPGIRLLAKKVGMPHWALKKRARELGLARTKELPWSEAELGDSVPVCVDERRANPSEAEGCRILSHRNRNPPQAEADAVQA